VYEQILLFASALAVGLTYGGMPGAINTEALRRGVKGGFRPAATLELGSCVGDFTWAAIALVGLSFLVQNRTARIALGVFGGSLLLYLAYRAFRDARAKGIPESNGRMEGNGLMAGALISLGNPSQVAFWLGIGGSAITAIVPNPDASALVVFMAGYMTGSVVWSLGYSGLLAYGRRFLTARLFQIIYLICGLVMAFFAVMVFWSSFNG
jgi:threonine/homoserine/homoserine lactone efflux protein